MAPDRTPNTDPVRRPEVEALFLALLCLCVVGLEPFGGGAERSGLDAGQAGGNALRQALHAGIFCATLVVALHRRVPLDRLAPSIAVLLFLGWCALSMSWALAPSISMRRTILLAIVVLALQAQVALLGPVRALRLARGFLLAVLLVNLVSISLVPQAVHLPGEAVGLDGDWRGIFLHKNQAGAVTAFTFLLLLHHAIATARARDIAAAALAAIFLAMTDSKTSFGLVLLAAPVSLAFRAACRPGAGGAIFALGATWATIFVVALALHHAAEIDALFEDPLAFTGRMALWASLVDQVRDNWALGSGYGSFWNLGVDSPISNLTHPDHWTYTTGQGHNGYLDLLVATGVPGLLLGLAAFMVLPLTAIFRIAERRPDIAAPALGVWLLFAGANMTESFLARGDTGFWVLFLFAALCVQSFGGGAVQLRAAESRHA